MSYATSSRPAILDGPLAVTLDPGAANRWPILTAEDEATGGAPTLLEPLPEADAVVSVYIPPFQPGMIPAVQRVIGSQTKLVGPVRNEVMNVAGPLPAPRYNDAYGFGVLSGVEY